MLDALRRFAISRSLFRQTTLARAVRRLGFVQADPIRAPARAQDLILRHRVKNYRAGDLEQKFQTLGIEEDFFIPYGFVTRDLHALMHPRFHGRLPWTRADARHVESILAFVRERGEVHPRDVNDHFQHGTVTNYWGGSSNATTHLMTQMHYWGLLRVSRRERGIRMYTLHTPGHTLASASPHERDARLDRVVDAAVRLYAPLPARSLSTLVSQLRYGVPQWRRELKDALRRAHARLAHTTVDGITWYWPATERLSAAAPPDVVRLLAPFDPVVSIRARFELFWGWEYRFEAYTPAKKRVRGYYALPLLWRDRVIGWGNLAVRDDGLRAEFGYVAGRPPRDRSFAMALEAEVERMRRFICSRRESA
ncbi:MAG TPA: crosslink repair DNA glycosylase YcaQ family protein [Vicinamibacterales bacterium]|nr:crosslink repair DNA glycosylase YcaQ family protein [Vicinamibacterales bacterium]